MHFVVYYVIREYYRSVFICWHDTIIESRLLFSFICVMVSFY